MRRPRFEVVRTDAQQPWHARLRSANGRITWTTENYWNEQSAHRAVGRMVRMFGGFVDGDAAYTYVGDDGSFSSRVHRADIRIVDERATP
jgi:uncharacterized protein YegP (UPF0339 family)